MNRRNFLKKSVFGGLFGGLILLLNPLKSSKQNCKAFSGFFIGNEKNYIKSDDSGILIVAEMEDFIRSARGRKMVQQVGRGR